MKRLFISMIIITTGGSRNSAIAKQPVRASQNHFSENQRQINMYSFIILSTLQHFRCMANLSYEVWDL